MSWFKEEVIKYSIIEVERGTKLPEITPDLRDSLKTLQFSPAFQYLIMRFRNQRAAMTAALQGGMNLTEIQLRYLQAGIHWAGELERDITALTQASASTPRPAFDNEAAEFAKIAATLDLIDA